MVFIQIILISFVFIQIILFMLFFEGYDTSHHPKIFCNFYVVFIIMKNSILVDSQN